MPTWPKRRRVRIIAPHCGKHGIVEFEDRAAFPVPLTILRGSRDQTCFWPEVDPEQVENAGGERGAAATHSEHADWQLAIWHANEAISGVLLVVHGLESLPSRIDVFQTGCE